MPIVRSSRQFQASGATGEVLMVAPSLRLGNAPSKSCSTEMNPNASTRMRTVPNFGSLRPASIARIVPDDSLVRAASWSTVKLRARRRSASLWPSARRSSAGRCSFDVPTGLREISRRATAVIVESYLKLWQTTCMWFTSIREISRTRLPTTPRHVTTVEQALAVLSTISETLRTRQSAGLPVSAADSGSVARA